MTSRLKFFASRWLMLAAFGLPGPSFSAVDVVASFSILGDITQRVGGERIKVHTLVGRNADAHVYQPTTTDAKTLARARLVVVNGLGFEGWIDRLIKSSGYRGPVLVASTGIKTLKLKHDENDHGHGHDSDVDPHAWQDLANAQRYVDNIAQALAMREASVRTDM